MLPVYLNVAETLPGAQGLRRAVLLLTWLYLMGNIVLLGAELNWWFGRGRRLASRSALREDEELGHA